MDKSSSSETAEMPPFLLSIYLDDKNQNEVFEDYLGNNFVPYILNNNHLFGPLFVNGFHFKGCPLQIWT